MVFHREVFGITPKTYSCGSNPNLRFTKVYSMREIEQKTLKNFFFFLICLIQPALAFIYFLENEKQFISDALAFFFSPIFFFYYKENRLICAFLRTISFSEDFTCAFLLWGCKLYKNCVLTNLSNVPPTVLQVNMCLYVYRFSIYLRQ